MAECILQMKGISKSFPGVKALSNVSLEVYPGEVHALMGENGAGKSTLMKILNGIYQPDEGEIIFNGKKVIITSPYDALKTGISMVRDEASFFFKTILCHSMHLTNQYLPVICCK